MNDGRPLRIMVTGAEERQGLGVIRALGRAGHKVIACGSRSDSIGFASRYARERRLYTSPLIDRTRSEDDLVNMVCRHRPDLVIPGDDATLVVLNSLRRELAQWTTLAAAAAETLDYALDRGQALRLAERLEVPVPTSVEGKTVPQILHQAADLRLPVAVKPRGPWLHGSTAHQAGLPVRYARTLKELADILEPVRDQAGSLLVQEYAPGVGRCVTAVCRQGQPLVMFAYARLRELPRAGGVSVVCRSEPVDDRLRDYTTTLLGAINWHGVAAVEYRYDRRTDRFTFMEINGRFPASVALSLDANLNLPDLVARMFAGRPEPVQPPYRTGVTERWLRGDILALGDALAARTTLARPEALRPNPWHLVWEFLRDFRPGVRLDEFKWWDPKPSLAEAAGLARLLARSGRRGYATTEAVSAPPRQAVTASARAPAHERMRA